MKRKWFIEVRGLKCDAEGCGYTTDDVKLDEYESYINAPCPRCGAPLLTQADYDNVIMINKFLGNPFIRAINWIGKKISYPVKTYEVKMNGTGEMKIKEFYGDITK